MAKFVKCTVENFKELGRCEQNNPINIELCVSVEKSLHVTPSNIKFSLINGQEIWWKYGNESQRDTDYEWIINNKFE